VKYFHCPTTYKGKAYGCGRGPYNATQACLDMWGTCKCGKELKPYKPTREPAVKGETCAVVGVTGERYCHEPTSEGKYCRRHAYLNNSAEVE
jgi:hypothetical protein